MDLLVKPNSPFCHRVVLVARYCGIDIPIKRAGLPSEILFHTSKRQQVPTLVVNNKGLAESLAIIEYLTNGTHLLFSRDAWIRSQQIEAILEIDHHLAPSIKAIVAGLMGGADVTEHLDACEKSLASLEFMFDELGEANGLICFFCIYPFMRINEKMQAKFGASIPRFSSVQRWAGVKDRVESEDGLASSLTEFLSTATKTAS